MSKKTKYSMNMTIPNVLVILQLQTMMVMMMKISMMKSSKQEQNRPLLLTDIDWPLLIADHKIQGSGSLQKNHTH